MHQRVLVSTTFIGKTESCTPASGNLPKPYLNTDNITTHTIKYKPFHGQVSQIDQFFFFVEKDGNVFNPLANRIEGLFGGVRDSDRVFEVCKSEGGPERGLDAERVECWVYRRIPYKSQNMHTYSLLISIRRLHIVVERVG